MKGFEENVQSKWKSGLVEAAMMMMKIIYLLSAVTDDESLNEKAIYYYYFCGSVAEMTRALPFIDEMNHVTFERTACLYFYHSNEMVTAQALPHYSRFSCEAESNGKHSVHTSV